MAYNDEQNEPIVPINSAGKRNSSDLLPRFFRSNGNKKFLNATIDQLIQPGAVKKINGYIGRENAKSAVSSDIILNAVDKNRQDYQLEPAAIIKDYLGNTTFFKDYIDHINHLDVFGGNVSNHNRLNSQEFYSWNPHIDWDKFVNFQQYYWLPYGPDAIRLSGQQKAIQSTYTVQVVDEEDNYAYLFTPNGLTRNPTLKLFRGQTYIFDIDAEGHPFSIKRKRTEGTLDRYNVGISKNAVEVGQIVFEVPENAPDVLFYVSENAVDTGGVIQIFDIEENTFIDVGSEIIGKKTYTVPDVLGNPLPLSNGMKVEFIGEVLPAEYGEGYWYVEGVGSAIKLISEKELEVRSTYVEQNTLLFDDLPFDQLPFSEYGNLPSRKDYITINRASPDNNAWSRYNRWFHKDVIETSARINFKQPDINQKNRATRPIIEFNPGIKLYNHGVKTKKAIDVIDNFTKDAFSTVEGSIGYNVDGIDLADGMRIIFNADTDILVKNKVYKVNFIKVNIAGKTLTFNAETQIDLETSNIRFESEHGLSTGNQVTYLDRTNLPIPGLTNRQTYWVKTIDPFRIALFKNPLLTIQAEIFNISSGTHAFEVFLGKRKQIHLTEEFDSVPELEETVPVRYGTNDTVIPNSVMGNQGQSYWFNGDTWLLAQTKLSANQPPVFDVFDKDSNSYGDSSVYEGSSFKGTKIFSYKIGTGSNDTELGFPLSYQNINNVGDIVFDFNLLIDKFSYKVGNEDVVESSIDAGYVKVTEDLTRFKFENGWTTSVIKDTQPVVRVYKGNEQVNAFAIDTFSKVNQLDDLKVKVYLNGKILKSPVDYTVETRTVYKYVVLSKDIGEKDILTIKSFTKQPKNSKGHYEFPINLQNNPLNNNVETFTLGEVLNHVESIVENLDIFNGSFPGNGNLRDLGPVEKFGTRFVQHSGPLNLALYHLGSKDSNIIKAVDRARDDYTKFKRAFILEAESSSFFGTVPGYVNDILQKINRNKSKSNPYYLSDMFAYSAANVIKYEVLDSRIKKYPLTVPFNLNSLTSKSVTIYLNGNQLLNEIDYHLGDDEFFEVFVNISEGDILEAYEWDTTDGSFCPATPTKLGIYPAYEPKIYIDKSYVYEKETFQVHNSVSNSFTISNANKILIPRDFRVIVNNNLKDYIVDYNVIKQNNVYTIVFNEFLDKGSVVEIFSPIVVIQGHDGSITVAFNDYRDDLILELEKRIFNNLKVKYDPNLFDIYNYIPNFSRKTDYSRKEFNSILSIPFFNWLQLVGKDFTKNLGFDNTNVFTYNLNGTYSIDNTDIPRYWRGVYHWFFDTDRPHTHPWECLGFTIKPKWWEETYGPAPYTSNNLILWDDIRQGVIREPNKLVVRNTKLAKTALEYGIPVDSSGDLLPPLDLPFVKGAPSLPESNDFSLGDWSPVESAWYKSSYYPFALLRACILMNPSDVLGRTLDRSRLVRNKSGQIVYSTTGLRLKLKDLLVPSVANFNNLERIYAAGVINYIVDYLSSENTKKLDQYKTNIKLLTNLLSTRIGAFTSKPKYKILLDSKNPSATSGVFVPEENYNVELNISSSIKRLSYSGVIVTKLLEGFEVKGYDYGKQYFITYPFRSDARTVSVGGISESYLVWEPDRTYVAGKVIRYESNYYRVKVTHTTSNLFDSNFYAMLSELPIIGGRQARLRKDWDFESPVIVPYNTVFPTIQEVVDFLQGYGEHLKREGFVFEQFNNNLSTVVDWITSVKEFLFWTTQNWAEGSVISLSPAANKLTFKSNNAVVDNIKDQFYEYSVFRVDGKKIEPENLNVFRNAGVFELELNNVGSGIYCAVLNLVQKEHVLVLDSRTIFNDVIYDLEAGFRQERLKVIGYTTVNWTGGFEIPGFIFDQVKILDWEPWTDYNLGDVVKNKEFYYSAKKFLPGVENFNISDWILIDQKLESKLIPNWDYRTEQFTDFYDLDTNNFDVQQQRVAQHTIGYQKRQYLENIINNDVSQYKFYQGMIAEKGTQNVLNKLFDVLSQADQESLTFDEEWGVRVGDYGAVDAFDEVEIILDEKEFKVNPQPLEVTNRPVNDVDFVYRQRYDDLYIKPSTKKDSSIFELSPKNNYLRTTGYVRDQDVLISVDSLEKLTEVSELSFLNNDYIHTAFEGSDWNVYKIYHTRLKVLKVTNEEQTEFLCNRLIPFKAGSYIKLESLRNTKINGFYRVARVAGNKFFLDSAFTISDTYDIFIFNLESQRLENIDDLNDIILKNSLSAGSRVWVDKTKNDLWASLINNPVYSLGQTNNQDPSIDKIHGRSITISQNGNICAVSSGKEIFDISGDFIRATGEVVIYEKGSSNNAWRSSNRFDLTRITEDSVSLGSVIKLSKDGEWFAIAAPKGQPSNSQEIEQGFVNLYKRQPNGKYIAVPNANSGVNQFTESFAVNYGTNIAFSKTTDGYLMAVSSLDKVYVYKHTNDSALNSWTLISTLEAEVEYSDFGKCLEFADFDNILVVSAPNYDTVVNFDGNNQRLTPGHGKLYVYRYVDNSYSLLETLEYSVEDQDYENFGSSVAISNNASYLAVGANLYDANKKADSGAVLVYRKQDNSYELYQTITSVQNETNEQFGYAIGFMNDDETLAISSLNSNIIRLLTFDVYKDKIQEFTYELANGDVLTSVYINNKQSPKNTTATTFDRDTTRFNSTVVNVGRVDVYDKYNTKFAYGETLENTSKPTDNYSQLIAVGTNTILVSAPNAKDKIFENSGLVYSYVKPAKRFSWESVYEQLLDVNVDKIKKAYLYNKRTNELVTYLDVVDATQGKIPGIAEQELRFKTYYDPAIYSVGAEDLNIDDGLNWTNNHIGQLWWDLTRARFIENSLGDLLYKSINWNQLYKTASIDIYEWVESKLLPADWDAVTDTEEGLAKGISGKTKYGNGTYSVRSFYDPISQNVKSVYYYWVKNKKTIPNVEGRSLSADNVSKLIADPTGYGYPCISFNSNNSFNLVNLERYTEDKDIVISIQQWLVDNRTNYHSEWKLISENSNTKIPKYIEQKWFHSLVGKDDRDLPVPDLNLPFKLRYGVEFKPRQGMFVNRLEPLKQLVDKVNSVLKNVLVVDTYNLSNLSKFEESPNRINALWDVEIDTEKELRFVSSINFKKPVLSTKITNGKIVDIEILDKGFGYNRYRSFEVNINQDPVKWYGPEIIISGSGKNAKVRSIIDQFGSVISYVIENPGEGYGDNTVASMREISVLVKSDSTAFDGWAIYSWNLQISEWQKTKVQGYNVSRYWKYINWYASGINEYTKPDFLFNNTYEILISENIPVGSIIKIKNIGKGGWSLLRKYNDKNTIDYTENFEIVGRENGTIEFLENIYKPTKAYDSVLLDTTVYDNYPIEELRIILSSLRDDILVGELREEYIGLFIDSVKYVLKEQIFADWVFKSSFVKAKHNVGSLTQKPAYKNDNLEDFESFLKEVKPYRTKIREFVSDYNYVDPTKSNITDFDILPVVEESREITPLKVGIVDNKIVSNEDSLDIFNPVLRTYPWKNWLDNVGFEITSIEIVDGGEGYISRPKIKITGNKLEGGHPAFAKAYITKGSVNRIDITHPGSRWISSPTVEIIGTLREGGRPAKAIAIIGNSVIRSNSVIVKFDRISKSYQVTNLEETETFSGPLVSGSRAQFPLKWSPNIDYSKYTVVIDGAEVLKNEYTLSSIIKTVNGTTKYSGLLTFNRSPIQGSVITVNYFKNFDHLDAVDRINFFYDPQTGQLGKDLSQLMTGIDYGGVSITGLDFKNTYGWDALPWVGEVWDSEVPDFDDHIVSISDESQREFRLPYVPEEEEEITVYISKLDTDSNSPTYLKYLDPVRIDHPQYPVVTPENVVMKSFVGDGETNTIILPNNITLEIYEIPDIVLSGNSETVFYTDTFDGGNSENTNVNQFINGQYSNTPVTFNKFGDRVIFRKTTSDGSINPREEDYDTVLTGGDWAYYTARGVAADDIVLDGDDLVTAANSHAPEEVVPGQIMDTLSIKVYTKPAGGAPSILFKSYTADGNTTEFNIGQYFLNNSSVIVKVDNLISNIEEDYVLDYQNNQVVFVSAPSAGQKVSVISVSFSSASILDLDYFIADGETIEYVTRAPWASAIHATVLVNGQVEPYEIFATDNQYVETNETWRARVGIRFAVAPAQGSVVNYIIDRADVEQTASVAKSEIIDYDIINNTYELTNPVGIDLPLEPNVLIKADSFVLRSPSYNYFNLADKKLTYQLLDSKYQAADVNSTDIKVYLEGKQLALGKDFSVVLDDPIPVYGIGTFTLIGGTGYNQGDIIELQGNSRSNAKLQVKFVNSNGGILTADLIEAGEYFEIPAAPYTLISSAGVNASSSFNFVKVKDFAAIGIKIKKSKYKEGAKLVVGITKNADYEFNSPTSITFKKVMHGVQRLEVLSFFNHNILGIERTEDVFDQTPVLDPSSPEYYEYNGKFGGRFTLRSTVPSGSFVWVIKNGHILSLDLDYVLEADMQTVRLIEYPISSDVIQIIAFTNTVVNDSFGYMQFKDMMNRVHFKRLNKNKATRLSKELKPFDRTIEVLDAAVLDIPNPLSNRPGVIEIYGERIEYFKVEGNVLSQLRRATLGTGVADSYAEGTLVQNIGSSETIPYKDDLIVTNITSTGSNTLIGLPYVPSKDDIEVFVGGYRLKKNEYNLYANNAFPYSPEGDVLLPPEFEVTGNGLLKLETPPQAGIKIMIVRKQGHIWNDVNKRLANSNNKIAKFIKEVQAEWIR